MFDAFAENERIIFLVLSGNNGCYCAIHFFRRYFTTSMFVWLPGTALVTTAMYWLPGRCWSYSQYSLEICYATECFWYWKRYLNSWRSWHLVFGIRNLFLRFGIDCWKLEFGLRFSEVSGVFFGSAILSPVHCAGRLLISQARYW